MSATRRAIAALAVATAGALLPLGACFSGSASKAIVSCASRADCSGGQVCGFANTAGDAGCSARGVCVVPVDEQPTHLCGCGGASIELVVNDVDAGVYYWSGVIVGEKGFPPCGDAAIAPSSNGVDASAE